jgi:hypothetical protein
MRKSMLLPAVFAVLVSCSSDQATAPPIVDNTPHVGYFVTVNGSQTGDGSAAYPWDLATALAQPGIVQPGDTIWIHGGTYQGDFTSRLTGTPSAPVILRQYPGERATIDGKLDAVGSYAWYWGFEVMYSDLKRVSSVVGSDPTDLPRYGKSVGTKPPGTHNKFINLVVHDLMSGPADYPGALGTEMYGNIVYNNGWLGPDRPHGHGIYIQNQSEQKRIADNVVFNNFEYGMQMGGSSDAFIMNFTVEGNTLFGSGAPTVDQFGWQMNVRVYGGGPNLGNIVFRNNSIFHISPNTTALHLGDFQSDFPAYPLTFTGNRVQGMVEFNDWKQLTVTNNRFTTGTVPLGGGFCLALVRLPAGTSTAAYQWTGNTYTAVPSSVDLFVKYQDSSTLGYPDLVSWQSATGWDKGASQTSSVSPTAEAIVRANEYETGRGLITVWNPAGASTVNADVSAVLKAGDSYVVHQVYDIYGPAVVSGVYSGGSISIPLQAYTPPIPIGMTSQPPSTGIAFNVFLIRKR